MARKREKTETVGTGFGIAAAVEEAGMSAVVTSGDGLMEAGPRSGEELFSVLADGCAVDDASCVTPAAEARLVSAC